MSVELLPGQRNSSTIVGDGEGFFFHVNRVRGNKVYLKCTTSYCKGKSTTSAPLESGSPMVLTSPHTHEAKPQFKEVIELKRRLCRRSITESIPLKNIFNEECSR